MAKPQAKKGIPRWMLFAGLAVVGVAGYLMTEPPAQSSTSSRRTSERTPSRPAAKGEEVFTKEDFEAKFGRVADLPKNAFRPLVVSGRDSDRNALAPNQIPADYSGDNIRWVYTGTAIIDGVPNALVENPETGEGEFLKVGQTWKKSVVRRITPTALTLEGPSGSARTMELMKDPEQEADKLISAEVRPLSPTPPGMTGPITSPTTGGGSQRRADTGQPATANNAGEPR